MNKVVNKLMHTMQAIQVFQVEASPNLEATMHNVAGQLASTLRKTYSYDPSILPSGWLIVV